ncbi:hypothetical protein RF11_00927 [Thelohanellus kitauei]|uniref:Uncharacterized protein n=1 Tax=Thelohanellus kitauei TaxID=669202 RepID=A0A0C2MMJ9_THEKT|nr:hypothetical protein RF11_00927 [Thelohanellus kitauei]
MKNDDTMPQNRNYGMRVSWPWIFGLVQCIKENQSEYKSGEVRLLRWKEEIRLLSFHLLEVMSIPWAAYNSLDVNREFHHHTVNHSENFINATGTHTQNVEQMVSSPKSNIVINMRGTSDDLLLSHLHEFMWRSWNPLGVYETFEKIVTLGSEQIRDGRQLKIHDDQIRCLTEAIKSSKITETARATFPAFNPMEELWGDYESRFMTFCEANFIIRKPVDASFSF